MAHRRSRQIMCTARIAAAAMRIFPPPRTCAATGPSPRPSRSPSRWGSGPAPGAILVLVFANGLGLYWAGILSTFAMAVGTFITVSVIAALAVYSKKLAARMMRGQFPPAGVVRHRAPLRGRPRHRLSRNDPVPRLVGLHQRDDVRHAVKVLAEPVARAGGLIAALPRRGLARRLCECQRPSTSWYRTLAKPSWNPPDWVFGPVWTLLYIMMAIAAWLVWKTRDRVAPAMTLFFVQLALNLAWSLPVLRRALAGAGADRDRVPVG